MRCIAMLSPAAMVRSPLIIAVDCKLLLVLAVKARISFACIDIVLRALKSNAAAGG